MNKNERLDDHQKFKELAALAQRGALSSNERLELSSHLQVCDSCREAYAEYSLISREGMPFLAAPYGHPDAREGWDGAPSGTGCLPGVEARSPWDFRARRLKHCAWGVHSPAESRRNGRALRP